MSPETNILVRSPNWIGDQVLAFPFFHSLRKAYPKAHITSVCVGWVEDLQFKDLVDEVVLLPRNARGTFSEKVSHLEQVSRELKKMRRWDLGISLPNSLSSAWLLYRAGVSRRRGYRVDGRGILLNEGLPWDPSSKLHRAQAYVDLLPESARPKYGMNEFWGIPPENELDLGVPGELATFDHLKSWPSFERVEPPVQPYWVMAPGSTAESRRWPTEFWLRLARLVSDEMGWKGLIVGGPSEVGIATRLSNDSSAGLLDRTAQGPVPGLAEIFKGAQFTVSNESGLAHVAALCGSFVQIVCGAADPRRTRPLGPGRVQVAINPVECWPCERNTCSQPAETKLQCLRGIQPETVWEEIKRGIRLARTGLRT